MLDIELPVDIMHLHRSVRSGIKQALQRILPLNSEKSYNYNQIIHVTYHARPARTLIMPLPFLPIELQFAILRDIPPNQLFVLRRISRSWNVMLDNPHLLADINRNLPFLTSASDLTSRMKRRMRMTRGEPVWVKPFHEVFPWAKSNARGYGKGLDDWQQFSGGWLVVLSRAKASPHPHSRRSKYYIKLSIGGLLTQRVTEVDVLAVMESVNPDIYQVWDIQDALIEDALLPPEPNPDHARKFYFEPPLEMLLANTKRRSLAWPGSSHIKRFYLHVQEGMAVVGLRRSKAMAWMRERGFSERDPCDCEM